jgi:hypothetical protein
MRIQPGRNVISNENKISYAFLQQGRIEMKDNLSKAVGDGRASQRLIPTGEQSGLLMRIAATGSVSLCTRMKSCTAFLQLEVADLGGDKQPLGISR